MFLRTGRSILASHQIHRYRSIQVTAAQVKALRESSGAPMMECKKALMDPEVNGDVQKAMDWLRAKGIAKASSQSNRVSVEGLIAVYQRKNMFTLVEVNSETDFVSRNKDFQKFVAATTATVNALPQSGTLEVTDVLKLPVIDTFASKTGETVQDILGDITTSIRENIVLRRAENLDSEGTHTAAYVHGKVVLEGLDEPDTGAKVEMGREVSLVSLRTSETPEGSTEKLHNAARRLAMHVVAAKPTYLSSSDIPSSVVEAETAIYREQTLATPLKNPAMLDKIVAGKVSKRMEEMSLTGQTHMAVEGTPVISKYLQTLGKEISPNSPVSVSINKFVRWNLGQSA